MNQSWYSGTACDDTHSMLTRSGGLHQHTEPGQVVVRSVVGQAAGRLRRQRQDLVDRQGHRQASNRSPAVRMTWASANTFVTPPSTCNVCPVTNRDSSQA